ncbi:hypothetical protein ACHQM5_017621 [Ranunculus cassubicifolius]
MDLSLRVVFTLLFFLSVLFSCYTVHAQSSRKLKNRGHSISAILVFGDSTVDPGNNDYIKTAFRTNFPPYGRDLPNHIPTGRCTNGKLVTDFTASYLGIKEYVPPYLNNSLSINELITGVSFASAGSGYDPFTAHIGSVNTMAKQREYFKEYKERLGQIMGTEKMESHIQKAVFVVSCGTNDFGINYFLLPVRRKQYIVAVYQKFVIQNAKDFLQGLLDLGAQKIAIVGVPPIGCLPILITLNSYNTFPERQCIDSYNTVAKQYNTMLQNELQIMIKNNVAKSGFMILYIDIYEPLLRLIQSHEKFGFEEWRRGCCGTGLLELGFLCSQISPVCPNPSKFIWWDSVHPTERVYYLLFEAFQDIIDRFI